MTEYDNTNRGVLFKNDRKTSDKHPDYKGSANIDGRDFWVSAWIKKGQKGTFMSFSYEAKDAQPGGHPDRFRSAPSRDEPDASDIPF